MVFGDGDSTVITLLKLGEDLYTSELMLEWCRSCQGLQHSACVLYWVTGFLHELR
ncbi:hypothetical protein T02_7599 [Trichinella nativa]|uniref:Uncharacterized protein n=1 Tax=Trichinella nativa TaxID=6335 RepID=A0A0V1KIR6_9BILA|nr:hypothetical protein T02_7599 [Trichinella nativa]